MNRAGPVVLLTVGLMFVGAAFLKGFADTNASDPKASVGNGAPRGLLALWLLLAAEKQPRVLLARFDDAPPPPGRNTLLVPPPEASAWLDDEVNHVMERVRQGDRLVILCDDDGPRTERLEALLDAAGATCFRADVPIGDEAVTQATGVLPGYPQTLYVRGAGRVRPRPSAPSFTAWTAAADGVVVRRQVGAGAVTVVSSATVLANDGLGEAENAAFALAALAPSPGGSVIIDERHHASRSQVAVLEAALRGAGPLTALLALILLVPLSLLALSPRPGDPPRVDDVRVGAPAAAAQARALAALLAQVSPEQLPPEQVAAEKSAR